MPLLKTASDAGFRIACVRFWDGNVHERTESQNFLIRAVHIFLRFRGVYPNGAIRAYSRNHEEIPPEVKP